MQERKFANIRKKRVQYFISSIVFVALAACGRNNNANVDEQLRADLAAAASATSQRQQFVSPQELSYGQSYMSANPAGYPAYGYGTASYGAAQNSAPNAQVYSQPAPRSAGQASRVVYTSRGATGSEAASSRSNSGAGGSREVRREEERNTQKGAIIGAAAGAAIGVATARDKVKGGAIGALGGAVLGGVIGHQVKTQRN